MLVFQGAQLSLMHPFHMPVVIGVFGGSFFSLVHAHGFVFHQCCSCLGTLETPKAKP